MKRQRINSRAKKNKPVIYNGEKMPASFELPELRPRGAKRPKLKGKFRHRTGDKIITTAKLRKIKADGMLNMAEVSRRARIAPNKLQQYWITSKRYDQILEREKNRDIHDRLRAVLKTHAIELLLLIGELKPVKVPGRLPSLQGIKRKDISPLSGIV